MTDIVVERIVSDTDTTVSAIFVDGRFACFGLEDEYREDKLAGETRIPAGHYRVIVRRHGGFHERYERKFAFHRGMLEIAAVPRFTDILIHIGNTDDHTAGCLLVGTGATCRPGDMSIQSSVEAYTRLYGQVIDAAERNDLTIEFIDRDREAAP